MNDIVLNKLRTIQSEYLELLESISPEIETHWEAIIDKINLFWYQRKKIILFAMKNYFPPQNTFVFTAATFLDYDEKEHFPFVICDGIRIIDDSVCTYGNFVGKIENNIFKKTIQKQLSYAIEDNIKVLKNCSEYFYILPISFLTDDNLDVIVKGSEDVFLKLFEPKLESMENYFQKINTIEDLKKSLKPGIERSLMFFSGDDIRLNLSERISNYIAESSDSLGLNDTPINKVFYTAIYPQILQSLKILMLCAQYNIIPYLRYDVAFHNFSFILPNYPDQEQRKILEDKVYTSFLIYKAFDLESIELANFKTFAEKLKDTNIFKDVYDKMRSRTPQTSATEIGDFAHEQLKCITASL